MDTVEIVSPTKSLEPKLRRFECDAPITSEDIVRDQMQKARVYFQVLLDIEKERKLAYRRASSKFAEASDKEANILLTSLEIQDLQTTLNKKTTTTAQHQLLARIAYLRGELKAQKIQLKMLKEHIKNDRGLMATAAQIDQMAREKVKFARKNSNVYWGTYLMVEASVSKKEAVASSYPPVAELAGYKAPSNKDSEGRIGIRMQTDLELKEAFGCRDSRFRLEYTPSGVHAWIRVGSEPDNIRKPIWSILPVHNLRLAPNSLITAVNVTNIVRDGKEQWFLDVWTLEASKQEVVISVPAPANDVQRPIINKVQRLVMSLLPQRWVSHMEEN